MSKRGFMRPKNANVGQNKKGFVSLTNLPAKEMAPLAIVDALGKRSLLLYY